MNRSMAFLSINLLINVIRERCDKTEDPLSTHKCVKFTRISPITEQSSPHSCFSYYREGITMWSSVVESCGHGAVHWFRDWSLITGRGATHCL